MPGYNLSQLKIMVVDDNPQMRDLIKSLLEVVGVSKVRMAANSDMAWEILKNFNPDMVITDWAMPPTDGIEFVKRIRRDGQSPNPYVPVLMLTGFTERYRVEIARDAGVNEFLAKPITAKQLFERMHAIVEDQRMFVMTQSYVGPDRRRKQDENYKGPERRKNRQS
ncbi:MAG: response regulator [Alphaproteobacteria bacterium]|nr:response regulator [Alphaproteobacteria bacterium]